MHLFESSFLTSKFLGALPFANIEALSTLSVLLSLSPDKSLTCSLSEFEDSADICFKFFLRLPLVW